MVCEILDSVGAKLKLDREPGWAQDANGLSRNRVVRSLEKTKASEGKNKGKRRKRKEQNKIICDVMD